MSRLRRVMLFMPGDDLHKIEKGAGMDVDCVIMDLEDGVAFSQKSRARKTVSKALQTLDFGDTEKVVRINAVGSGFEIDDLAGTIDSHPDGFMIPKVETAKQVKRISEWLDVREKKNKWKRRSIRLFAIIETPLGVVNLRKIAKSSKRLEALVFGAEDFAGHIGATRTAASDEVLYARSAVLTHAKAFGLQAIDTPFLNINNLKGLAKEAGIIAKMGFDGKLCIHPSHVSVIEDAFMPTQAEIRHAQQLIAAFDEHQKSGTGAFTYDDKMVDMPIVLAAQNVLSRALIRDKDAASERPEQKS